MFKHLRYPDPLILTCGRLYVAFPLFLRHLEDRAPLVPSSYCRLEKALRRRGRPVGKCRRMHEIYIRVRANGGIFTGPPAKTATPLTLCSVLIATRRRPGRYFEKSILRIACPRR